jgi:hypothetical protein
MISYNRKLILRLNKTVSLIIGASLISAYVSSVEANAKRLSFELPHYEKLINGAGPRTNDKAIEQEQTKNSQNQTTTNLAPLSLNGDAVAPELGPDGIPLLKSTVTKSEYSGLGQAGNANNAVASGESKSVVSHKAGELGGKVLKDAKSVNIMPLALIETEDEAEKKAETTADLERIQLTDLWQSTINRSPDIQFVINRLQPSSDANHAASGAMKMLGGALFGIMSAAPLLAPTPSPALYMGTSSGVSLIQSLFASQDAKNAKKAQISQEQATLLYKIVRDTADHLVEKYRAYKKNIASFQRATLDLQDLQAMVAESRQSQSAAQQVEMEYTLRKAQRDIDSVSEEVRQYRQGLIDLAGPDAIAKLDKQYNDEQIALQKITPEADRLPEGENVFKVPPQRTASQLNMQIQ